MLGITQDHESDAELRFTEKLDALGMLLEKAVGNGSQEMLTGSHVELNREVGFIVCVKTDAAGEVMATEYVHLHREAKPLCVEFWKSTKEYRRQADQRVADAYQPHLSAVLKRAESST